MLPRTDEAELAGLLETFTTGWNAGSGDALARAFAEDADFTNVMGLRAHGREVIARGHDEILATIFKGTRSTGVVEQIRLVRPDVAVVDAKLTVEGLEGLHIPGPVMAKAKFVATKEDGTWSIVSFTNAIPFQRPAAGPVERRLAEA
jgi:uncharacterized protein (TIGR02246 family)